MAATAKEDLRMATTTTMPVQVGVRIRARLLAALWASDPCIVSSTLGISTATGIDGPGASLVWWVLCWAEVFSLVLTGRILAPYQFCGKTAPKTGLPPPFYPNSPWFIVYLVGPQHVSEKLKLGLTTSRNDFHRLPYRVRIYRREEPNNTWFVWLAHSWLPFFQTAQDGGDASSPYVLTTTW